MTDVENPIEEADAIPEAVPFPQDSSSGNSARSKKVSPVKADRKLSVVSKKYDIDGDGRLDAAEQAMRDLDATGRGYLTNEKVYALMQEQLNMQRSLFQMKKVIIGLVLFVVILALSNLGTSYATAMLAKDSTTNEKNELVDKHTGETLGTDQAVSRFNAQEPATDETSERDLQSQVSYAATSSDFTQMTETDALKLLKFCATKNKVVVLTFTFNDGQATLRTVCSPNWSCASTFNKHPNPTEGTLCLEGTDEKLWIQQQSTGVYTVSGTELSYDNTAPDQVEYLTGDIDDPCHESKDCDDGLECTSILTKELDDVGTCSIPVMGEGEPCSIDEYMCDTSQGLVCSPPRGDIPAAEACDDRDLSCSNENDYCNIGSDGNGVCSSCDLADHTTCTSIDRPTCITVSGSFATCGCSNDDECSDGQTCGIPSTNCIADVFHYCSVDHNADFGCVQVGEAVWQASEGICVVATVADELVCDTDTYDCGCGNIFTRDPANNCEFPECPMLSMCTMEVRYCDNGSTASRDECCDFSCEDGSTPSQG